jgi:hypothetical protein
MIEFAEWIKDGITIDKKTMVIEYSQYLHNILILKSWTN